MNNKFYPWAMPLQTSVPSQKLPSQPDGAVKIMTWEQYQALKKKTADEVRKSKKRKSSKKSYYRMMNNEEKYTEYKIRKRKEKQMRAAKKESINEENKEREDVAETLLSLGKEG
jgi:hypothetical protein